MVVAAPSQAMPYLQPLNLGELLDHAFRLYRRHFFTFIAIYAVVEIPLTVIEWSFSNLFFPAWGGTPTVYFSAILNLFVRTLYTAAITRAVAESYLGQAIGFRRAFSDIGHKWRALIGLSFYQGLVNLVIFLWWLIPCIGNFTGVGMLIYFVWILAPLVAPVLILEDVGIRASVRRAWQLARQRFWWMMGVGLALALISGVAVGPSLVLDSLLTWLTASTLNDLSNTELLASAFQTLVNTFINVLYQPFFALAYVLVYFDLRIRYEGLDLALQANAATSETAFYLVTNTALEPSGDLFTRREFGYFVGITFLLVPIYGLVAGLIYLAASMAP